MHSVLSVKSAAYQKCSSLLCLSNLYKSQTGWQFHETDLIITADDLSVQKHSSQLCGYFINAVAGMQDHRVF